MPTPIPSRRAPRPRRFARARRSIADKLREFILPYEAVRGSDAPDARLLDFLQTSYEAAADRAGWDRAVLERR